MNIHNMVYKGTALGPPLRNIFYAYAAVAVNLLGFLEIIFADNSNCFKDLVIHIPNTTLHAQMRLCQEGLHKWGKANHVSFDPTKESQHILALSGGENRNFRLFGIPFDHADEGCYRENGHGRRFGNRIHNA